MTDTEIIKAMSEVCEIYQAQRRILAEGVGFKVSDSGVIDLDWANGWRIEPDKGDVAEAIVRQCRSMKHDCATVDQGPPNRGLENVRSCDTCKYFYKYDSSD